MTGSNQRSDGRTQFLGRAMRLWAEGWVTFVRSAGGRAEDIVSPGPWPATRSGGKEASHE